MTDPGSAALSQVSPLTFLPESWHTGPDVWCRAYVVIGVGRDALRRPITVDLGSQAVAFCWGSLPRLAVQSTIRPTATGEITIEVEAGSGTHAEGPVALLTTPITTEWSSETIENCRRTVQAAAGLMATHSRCLVESFIEDYVIRLPDGRLEPTAVKVGSGTWLRRPRFDGEVLADLATAGARITQHPDRARLHLSLRWMDEAVRGEGVDALIKAWIAIETLAMPDTTNIRPLNESLARAYGLTVAAARDSFLTGHLASLRSQVVHDGDIRPVNDTIIAYIHALFTDLLFDELGLGSGRAIEMLDHPELDVRALILGRL